MNLKEERQRGIEIHTEGYELCTSHDPNACSSWVWAKRELGLSIGEHSPALSCGEHQQEAGISGRGRSET